MLIEKGANVAYKNFVDYPLEKDLIRLELSDLKETSVQREGPLVESSGGSRKRITTIKWGRETRKRGGGVKVTMTWRGR